MNGFTNMDETHQCYSTFAAETDPDEDRRPGPSLVS